MGIRIYITGRVAVELDGEVVINERRLRGKQGRLVFAYLVCERTRAVPKEELATAVWPQDLPRSWEGALSALISRLGSLLSSDSLKARGVSLSRGFGLYRILLPTDAWIDLEAGTSAIDQAEGALRAGEPGRVLGPATIAATVARRAFLPGVNGEWVDSQRGKLERQLLRSVDCLSEMWLSSGDSVLAVETATKAVALDPFRERSYQLLMKAYAAGGNRAKAIELYHRLRELLAEELGTETSSETQALYLKMLG